MDSQLHPATRDDVVRVNMRPGGQVDPTTKVRGGLGRARRGWAGLGGAGLGDVQVCGAGVWGESERGEEGEVCRAVLCQASLRAGPRAPRTETLPPLLLPLFMSFFLSFVLLCSGPPPITMT